MTTLECNVFRKGKFPKDASGMKVHTPLPGQPGKVVETEFERRVAQPDPKGTCEAGLNLLVLKTIAPDEGGNTPDMIPSSLCNACGYEITCRRLPK